MDGTWARDSTLSHAASKRWIAASEANDKDTEVRRNWPLWSITQKLPNPPTLGQLLAPSQAVRDQVAALKSPTSAHYLLERPQWLGIGIRTQWRSAGLATQPFRPVEAVYLARSRVNVRDPTADAGARRISRELRKRFASAIKDMFGARGSLETGKDGFAAQGPYLECGNEPLNPENLTQALRWNDDGQEYWFIESACQSGSGRFNMSDFFLIKGAPNPSIAIVTSMIETDEDISHIEPTAIRARVFRLARDVIAVVRPFSGKLSLIDVAAELVSLRPCLTTKQGY